MAEEAVPEPTEPTIVEPNTNPASEDMDLETLEPAIETKLDGESESNGVESTVSDESKSKRAREEEEDEGEENRDGDAKKQKVEEKSLEEQRLENKLEGSESGRVNLGPKSFETSVEMFDYFYKFLHFWSPNLTINKYEHMALLELLKKGHAEPDKKIGCGIHAFQVRYHPVWKSRCFFLIRDDESVDDFSFRKCVDHILPLPENMKVKSDVNKALGGSGGGRGGKGGGGRGGGRGHGRGRWGKSRN